SGEITLAANAVDEFHSQLDSEQYQRIYDGSDPEFHKISNQTKFVSFLLSIRSQLCPVTQAQLQSSQVGWFAGQGTVVTLVYHTRFTSSTSGEKFIWHFDNHRPTLHGYYISSNALVTK